MGQFNFNSSIEKTFFSILIYERALYIYHSQQLLKEGKKCVVRAHAHMNSFLPSIIGLKNNNNEINYPSQRRENNAPNLHFTLAYSRLSSLICLRISPVDNIARSNCSRAHYLCFGQLGDATVHITLFKSSDGDIIDLLSYGCKQSE